VGPNTICPAHKRVLMKDRKQVPGGISQQEVLASTCPNTATLSIPFMVSSGWNIDQFKASQTENESDRNQILNNQGQTLNDLGVVTSYAACSNSDDWFISPKVITCSYENRVYGFVADPRDCSQFYICDQAASNDGTSKGYLMSCVAGLWWDQSKRMCASPMDVPCNPFKIINTHGGTSNFD
jgi:hypothetical protein